MKTFFTIAFAFILSVGVASAQTPVQVITESFLGSTVNTNVWTVFDVSKAQTGVATVAQASSSLSVRGNGLPLSSGIVSNSYFDRRAGDIVLEADMMSSNCSTSTAFASTTSTTASSTASTTAPLNLLGGLGYGDPNLARIGSSAHQVQIKGGLIELAFFQDNRLIKEVSTGVSCVSNVPFHVKLVAKQLGGAELYINNSGSAQASVSEGTFTGGQVYMQSAGTGATITYSNFSFYYIPKPLVNETSLNISYSYQHKSTSGSTNTYDAYICRGYPIVAIAFNIEAPNQCGPASAAGTVAKGNTVYGDNTLGGAQVPDFSTSDGGSGLQGGSVKDPRDANTGLIPCGYNGKECTFNDLIQLANNLINFLIYISVTIATIAFAYAGFLYLTSAGDSGKVKQATTIFTNVGIGFIIILCAYLIVTTVLSGLTTDEFIKIQK